MAKYRIHIDRDTCIGDKQCGDEAPGTFYVDDEGKAVVTDPEGDAPEQVLSAAQKCQREAITLYDSDTGEKVQVSKADRGRPGDKRVLDAVVQEHRELRETIQGLQRLLEQPLPESGSEPARSWADRLATQLQALRETLAAHFRQEQDSGLFETLAREFPRAADRLGALQAEHDQILSHLAATPEAILSFAQGRPATGDDPRVRANELLGQLARHEAAETELIGRLHSEDLGTGD